MKTKEEINEIVNEMYDKLAGTNFRDDRMSILEKYKDIIYNLQLGEPVTTMTATDYPDYVEPKNTKPEPSRTEIAAIITANIAGRTDFLVTTNEANIATVAIRLTDELIKQLNET